MQCSTKIHPDLRANFDYIFSQYIDNTDEQEKIYKYYAGMFPSLGVFRQVFLRITENHGVMVIVRRGAGRLLNEKVFHYEQKV